MSQPLKVGRAARTAGAWSAALMAALTMAPKVLADDRDHAPTQLREKNPSGTALTISTAGPIDPRGLFFTSLGTNGRSCGTCHQASDGWSVTPPSIRERFDATRGTDPIFRLNDGAVSPHADVSTLQKRERAYAMLLSKGLVRIGIGIPANAQFELAQVDDPYGYASASELSLFRRPLAATNLRFLSTVMWDGRETFRDSTSTDCLFGTTTCFASLHFDLADQANSATINHAQAANPLAEVTRDAIVAFELGLYTAQIRDDDAGHLAAYGAKGGPVALSTQPSYFGINDTLAGDYQTHANFNPVAMTLYSAWQSYIPDARRPDEEGRDRGVAVARRAVARGEALFNTKPILITTVGGLNDDLGVATILGSCTTCHDSPNAGDHSVPLPLNIGLADASRRTPDMPLYTLRNTTTGQTVQTTDPGRALVTGQWKDIGRFKGPTLRALAARAPYFHNGFAKNLNEVVKFYNDRFNIGFTDQEKEDLIAFLKTL
jgi:cytochrome c peroxidase